MEITAALVLLALIGLGGFALGRGLWRAQRRGWFYGLCAGLALSVGFCVYLAQVADYGYLAGLQEILLAISILIGPAAGLVLGGIWGASRRGGVIAVSVYMVILLAAAVVVFGQI